MKFTSWVFLAAAVELCRAGWKDDGCKIELTEVAAIQTEGCAGIEHFNINGLDYLAAANFWNGFSRDMSAASVVYRVSMSVEKDKKDKKDKKVKKDQKDKKDRKDEKKLEAGPQRLELEAVQHFRTQGAHGFDFFSTPQGERLLVVPNYYGCGSSPVAQGSPQTCNSTSVHMWKNSASQFVEIQTLHTQGPGQTDHFSRGQDVYLVVGENFANMVSIHRWNNSKGGFEREADLPSPGAGATAIANIDGDIYLVASSYHDAVTGWSTQSPVYRWKQGGKGFEFVQKIAGSGVHDAEHIEFRNNHYLFLSEDRSDDSSQITSQVLIFDRKQKKFEHMQALQTDGAHAAELFVSGKWMFLAVANFGDRHKQRYNAKSSVWFFDEGSKKHGQFVKVALVPTVGATDFEHFVFDGKDYLAVSNEGNLGTRVPQDSYVYRMDITCSKKEL